MCAFQLAISVLQLGVSAARFHEAPLRNGVNVAVCAASLPLVAAGLTALNTPDAEYAVATMQVYQLFFVLRSALVCFDYAFLVDTRKRFGVSRRDVALAGVLLAAVLILQLLNSLLVRARSGWRHMRRMHARAR